MENFITPFGLFVVTSVLTIVIAASLPLSLWYYFRAKSIAPYLAKKQELEVQIAERENKIRELRENLEKLQDDVVAAKELIKQGELAKEWLEEHKKEIADLEAQCVKLRAEYEGVKQQLDDLKGNVSDKQLELAELNKKLEDVSGIRSQLETEVSDKMAEKGKLATEISTLKAEKESLPAEVETLRQRLRELKGQEDASRKNLNELNKEISVAKADVERLKKDREALEKELAEKRNELKNVVGEVGTLEGRAIAAQKWIEQQQAIKADSTDKWKNLDLVVFDERKISVERAFAPLDEQTWLKDFEKTLEYNGFIFNPRAIKAFHTGLKCAQATPLVVLAGISGTGKSLLPELYSAALGMNFLPVPVQPRWDSPQDLFGFYNYMEGRYKATELSRLLWQYDIHNNPACRMMTSSKLPMNLVLLDEMNLARVEYYFSDLLSKLEMRKGLNEANPLERMKAEIELECNAADNVEAIRRIFVSPHTLFVGTMNEDESTQTLSDKVIDRANVLRFGRPEKLNAKPEKDNRKPDKGSFLKACQGQHRISSSQWDSWCKDVPSGNETQALSFLRETLDPVVAALDRVNRSYGFRVSDAMKAYVVNYPGDSFRDAVADQIEMKVLPKLNGLELEADGFADAKQALKEAIARTKDQALAEAFEKSCPSGATFFKWRGVMR